LFWRGCGRSVGLCSVVDFSVDVMSSNFRIFVFNEKNRFEIGVYDGHSCWLYEFRVCAGF
jgi:hypothetical protein